MESTKLTKTDLQAIETETQMLAGEAPTLESLRAEGYTESRWLSGLLDIIAGAGRVITLLIAEAIQSGAALIIGVVFAVLEYWRVYHGAEALGQPQEQAALIAVAVVVANVVHPIYRLRELRGKPYHETTRITGRGAVLAFWDRLTGQPVTERRDWAHNPVLDMAASVITLTTIFLAVYDLIAPILTAIIEGTATKPGLILAIELVMGLGLSLAGVFFLQAAAHEIGVRVIVDQPVRLADELEKRRAEHAARVESIRADVRARYMAGKIADRERKRIYPFGSTQVTPDGGESMPMIEHENGHGGASTGQNQNG